MSKQIIITFIIAIVLIVIAILFQTTPLKNNLPFPSDNYGGCVLGGCSGITCYDPEMGGGFSTCEALPEYQCYNSTNSRCERQSTGVCGWTQTSQLRQCIQSFRQ